MKNVSGFVAVDRAENSKQLRKFTKDDITLMTTGREIFEALSESCDPGSLEVKEINLYFQKDEKPFTFQGVTCWYVYVPFLTLIQCVTDPKTQILETYFYN